MPVPDRIEEGLKLNNIHHLLLLWTPNIFNPHKLIANLRHPIGEVFHTNHKQRPVKKTEETEYYIVEHRLFGKLVTVDIIIPTAFHNGIIPRIKQLFDRRFYYGHDKDFPQPFILVNRTFIKDRFDQGDYLKTIIRKARISNNFEIKYFKRFILPSFS
ncbi:MAG: hypothetical protein US51_C0054G0002 [Microgenomates group bacterium GW2011_GWA2_37_6]|nr:MAG: hypothetical protein US51_C0054G0002 [Microgenomates group bacterium GW2011_GWA2_37_6]